MRAVAAILVVVACAGAAVSAAGLLDAQSVASARLRLKKLSASTRARMSSRVLQPTYLAHGGNAAAKGLGAEPVDLTLAAAVPHCDWQEMDKELQNFAKAAQLTEQYNKECLMLQGDWAANKNDAANVFVDAAGQARNLKQHIDWAPLRALCIYTTYAYKQWNPPLWDNAQNKPVLTGVDANAGPATPRHHWGALTVCAVHGIHALRRAQQTYYTDANLAGNVKRDFPDFDFANHKRDMIDPVLFHGSTAWSVAHIGGKYRAAYGANGAGPRVVTEKAFFSSSRSSTAAVNWAQDEKRAAADMNNGGVVVYLGDNTAWVAPWAKKVAEDEYLPPPGTEFVVLDVIPQAAGNAQAMGCRAGVSDFKAEFVLCVERRRFARMLRLRQATPNIALDALLDQSLYAPAAPAPAPAAHQGNAAFAMAAAMAAQLTGRNYADSVLPAMPANQQAYDQIKQLLRPHFLRAICAGGVRSQRHNAADEWVEFTKLKPSGEPTTDGKNGADNAVREFARAEYGSSHLSAILESIGTHQPYVQQLDGKKDK